MPIPVKDQTKVKTSVEFKLVQTLLKIIHLTPRKSYVIIIYPRSQNFLALSEISLSWS